MMFAFLSLSVIEAMYLFNVSSNIEDIVIPGLDRSITSDFFSNTYVIRFRHFQG